MTQNPVHIDHDTYMPYLLVEGVRVDIELLQDCKAIMGQDCYQTVTEVLRDRGQLPDSITNEQFYAALHRADSTWWYHKEASRTSKVGPPGSPIITLKEFDHD